MGFSLETHLSFYAGMVQQRPGDRDFILPQPGWGPSMPGLTVMLEIQGYGLWMEGPLLT